ncbi:mucin-binding protein, partial [Limosilactobacillus mucosae]
MNHGILIKGMIGIAGALLMGSVSTMPAAADSIAVSQSSTPTTAVVETSSSQAASGAAQNVSLKSAASIPVDESSAVAPSEMTSNESQSAENTDQLVNEKESLLSSTIIQTLAINSADAPASSAPGSTGNAADTTSNAGSSTDGNSSSATVQQIADDDPMNHISLQLTLHYKKAGQDDSLMPDTVITTNYKRTTTYNSETKEYTATPFVLDSITQTGTKIEGLETPTESTKNVPAGWQYFVYFIPYVKVDGWSPMKSGKVSSGVSYTDSISLKAGQSPTKVVSGELTVTYYSTTHIIYIDTTGKTIKTDTIFGQVGETQTISSTVPAGWKMTTPQQIPTSITFGSEIIPDTIIKIEHDHVTVTHDNPQTAGTQIPDGATTAKFKGVDQSNLNKTVTRTVTITNPDGTVKTTKQTFTSTRDAVVDMVDGSVVYGAWTKGQWDAVDVPTIEHYTASQTNVPAQTVDGSTADATVNVTYVANAETVTVQWVDDTENGKVVYSTNVSLQPGKTARVWIFGLDDTGHASKDAIALSSMYNLVGVSDANVLKLYNGKYYDVVTLTMPTIDSWIDGNTYTIHLTHKISKTDGYSSPTKVALRKTDSERYPNLMYTDDAAWDKTHRTVKRTIILHKPTGDETIEQTVSFSCQAQYDMVTGEFKGYTDWNPKNNSLNEYTVPTVSGYKAYSDDGKPIQTIDEESVTAESPSSTVEIFYRSETITVQWIDKDEEGKIIYSTSVVGNPGENSTSIYVYGLDDQGKASEDAIYLQQYYELDSVSDPSVLTDWIAGEGYFNAFKVVFPTQSIDGHTYKVYLKHKVASFNGPEDPTKDPTKVALRTTNSERYPNLMYTEDAAWNKLHKDVTRTITVVKPDGSQSMTTQKLGFSRQAQYDMVTGEFKGYTDWKEGTQTFAAYTPSTIDGYTAETAPTATATGDSDNSTITLHYTANAQTAKIVYTDADGNTVKTDTVKGVTDQTVDTNSTVPTGWKLVDGQTVPATIKLGVNTPDTKITVEHDHVTVTNDN